MSLTLSLYRDILKKARVFDKQPILKVRITPPAFTQVFEAKAQERQSPPRDPYYYYTPHTFGETSFYQSFKQLFKDAVRTQSAPGLSNAFALVRDLNDTIAVATKLTTVQNKDTLKKAQPISISSEEKKSQPPTEFYVVLSGDTKKKPVNDYFRSEVIKIVGELDKMLKKNKLAKEEETSEMEKQERERQIQQLEEELKHTTPTEIITAPTIETKTETDEVKNKERITEITSSTPTEDTKPTIADSSRVNMWVRPSNNIGVGTILVSHPTHDLHDNRTLDCFYRSTVVITGVSPKLTYGLIVNKPLFPEEAKEKYQLFTAQHKDYKKLGIASMPATLEKANWFFGGPGDIHPPQQFNLSTFPTFSALHSSPQVPDAKPLLEGLYCGGSMMKLMNMIESGEADLSKVRLFVGGATWSQEQLRDEVNKGWWIQGEASADFIDVVEIFGSYPNSYEKHWDDALTMMGGEYLNFVQAAKMMGHPKDFEFDKSRVPYCTLQMLNVNTDNK